MAFHGGHIYVAAADAVLRFRYTSGQLKATAPGERIADLPHGPTGHSTRNIRFSPDGAWFYVTVGSSSNIDVDPDRSAPPCSDSGRTAPAARSW